MFKDQAGLSTDTLDYDKLLSVIFEGVGNVDRSLRDAVERTENADLSAQQMLRMQFMVQRWQLVNETSSAIIKAFGDTLKGILQRF